MELPLLQMFCNSNSAYSFDGTSYIEIPNSSFINNYISLSNRTINLQFKTNDVSVRQTFGRKVQRLME